MIRILVFIRMLRLIRIISWISNFITLTGEYLIFQRIRAGPRTSLDLAIEGERIRSGNARWRTAGKIYLGIVTIRFVGAAFLRNTALNHSLTTVMEARLVGLPLLWFRQNPFRLYNLTIGRIRIQVVWDDSWKKERERKGKKHLPEKRTYHIGGQDSLPDDRSFTLQEDIDARGKSAWVAQQIYIYVDGKHLSRDSEKEREGNENDILGKWKLVRRIIYHLSDRLKRISNHLKNAHEFSVCYKCIGK